jgi:OOP family OmpA-OmpF porin
MFASSPRLTIIAGALASASLALLAARDAPDFAGRLEERAARAIAEAGAPPVTAGFVSPGGFATRHPLLSAGGDLDEAVRDRAAKAVASVAGVGGVRWADGTTRAESAAVVADPLHCQEDVEALLRARTIRFEESSARMDAASGALVDEVAAALRPCLGSIIAITGHTDLSGSEAGNLALSRARAVAVRDALIARGIPADGLRARGLGSRDPIEGLPSTDPANRRIEFAVVSTVPVKPTPVDTPGPR